MSDRFYIKKTVVAANGENARRSALNFVPLTPSFFFFAYEDENYASKTLVQVKTGCKPLFQNAQKTYLLLQNFKVSLYNFKVLLQNFKVSLYNFKVSLQNFKVSLQNFKVSLYNFKVSLRNLEVFDGKPMFIYLQKAI